MFLFYAKLKWKKQTKNKMYLFIKYISDEGHRYFFFLYPKNLNQEQWMGVFFLFDNLVWNFMVSVIILEELAFTVNGFFVFA